MINYFYDCYVILNKVYSEKAFLKQAVSSTFIEEKNRSLTIKTVYGVLDNDALLSFYISSLTEKTPKLAIRTILKIAIFAIKFLNKHEYAITKNAVELCKKLGKNGASGFVNAFLRKFIKTDFNLPENFIDNLSIKYSYPKCFVERVVKDYGKERAESILEHREIKTCLSFYNINGEEYLKNKEFTYQLTPFDNVYFVNSFKRNEDYDKGLYTFQSIGSVAICDAIDSCPKLLDCCAAPGGKSVRLSYKCDSVVSLELHEHRVELINEYSSRMGRKNITAICHNSEELIQEFKGQFDAVLCDVPCTGSGVANENPDIKLKDFSSLKELNITQLNILKTASAYVKKGGYLYYSTCSIFNCENIDIINAFMSDIKGFEICQIDSKIPHETHFGTNAFLPDISYGVGFYIAKLKKV